MADLSQHANYTGDFSGLLNNLWLTLAVGSVCLVGYEIEVRVPRRRGWEGTRQRVWERIWRTSRRGWRSLRKRTHTHPEAGPEYDGGAGEKGAVEGDAEYRRLGDREAWEFGYIYQPKAWDLTRSRPVPRWPLQWIIESIRVREADMPPTWGCDITLHARFLRGSLCYVFLQALVILPILMPLHVLYAPSNISKTSMLRASVSSLVESSGSRWLWVHSILIWWTSVMWILTVLWIVWGGIGYRRREVQRLRERMAARPADAEETEGVKQFRTLMVLNIPPDMRDEDTLRTYFNHYLARHRARVRPFITMPDAMKEVNKAIIRPAIMLARNSGNKDGPSRVQSAVDLTERRNSGVPSRVQSGVDLAERRHSEAQSRGQSLVDLSERRAESGRATPVSAARPESPLKNPVRAESPLKGGRDSEDLLRDLDDVDVDEVILVRKLGSLISLRDRRMKVLKELELAHVKLARRVLAAMRSHKKHYTPGNYVVADVMSRKERLDVLCQELGHFVDDEPEQTGESEETVWDILHRLPRSLIDPYQSLAHLPITSPFHKTNAPVIDYLTTKLAYLTLLLDEARSKPLEDFATSSAAFVTFRDARTARLALRVLNNHPKRSLACHTHPAPNWVEILWPRLGRSVYRSGFVRGWVIFLGVWAFTLAWIFPVSLMCALTSLTNIAGFIPPLSGWLDANPRAAGVITSLAPVILVALLTIAICPILLVIANKAETIVTRLGIHNSVLERFWKFLMVNGVVFFAIGQSAIEAYLTAFRQASFDPLPIIASAFPTAAPYFASYILLQVAIQPCFEIFRFGLPAIVYWFGTKWSTIPRQRLSRTENPTFSHFSQLPYQLLAGSIMHLFMLLNPLVIPFTLIYYTFCYVVWKRQFTFVYGRLYENNGRRSCVRIQRYSMDALALAQVTKGESIGTGCLFAVTLCIKLILTRAIKQRFDNLEMEEADIMCPPVARDDPDDMSDSEENCKMPPTTLRLKSHFQIFCGRFADWVHKWAYDHAIVPPGYVRPIPFDHVLFGWLDRFFTYPMVPYTMRTEPSAGVDTVPDVEVNIKSVATPHPKLAPWEDIPPAHRARAYWDQPAYTDPYDDFLWLPRDPLSTLDLDDTVELRASITTSHGGDGRFASYAEDEEVEDEWREILVRSPTPENRPSDETRSVTSPMSDHRLLTTDAPEPVVTAPIDLDPSVGSEVGNQSTLRRGTIRFADGVQGMFRRPRSDTGMTHRSEAMTMRTLSRSSAAPSMHSIPGAPGSDSPEEELAGVAMGSGVDDGYLSPTRSSRFTIARQPSVEGLSPRSTMSFSGSGSGRMPHSADLGRSPSGRRPVPPVLAYGSGSSTHTIGQLSRHASMRPMASPTSPGLRTSSTQSVRRDRSSSAISTQQAALLREVMEEERIASQSAREEERVFQETEREEVRKERERSGSNGPVGTGDRELSNAVARAASTSGPMKRSVTLAPRAGGVVEDGAGRRRRGTLAGATRMVIAANRMASNSHSASQPGSAIHAHSRDRGVSMSSAGLGPVTAPLPLPLPSPGAGSGGLVRRESRGEATAPASASAPMMPRARVEVDEGDAGVLDGDAGVRIRPRSQTVTVRERMQAQPSGGVRDAAQADRSGGGMGGMAGTSQWGL